MNHKIVFGFLLFFFGFTLGLAQTAFGQTSTIPAQYPSIYRGVRPLGMGNAFVAMPGEDENAPFYNPAAINDFEKELNFRLISPTISLSTATIGLVTDIIDLAERIDAAATDGAIIDEVQTFVDEHIGEFHAISFAMPVVAVQHKWFHAAVLVDSRNQFSFRNRSFVNAEISSRSDAGGVFGGAYGFFEEQLQAGLNMKILHRLSIDEVLTTDDFVNSDDFADAIPINRATGVGVDLGLKGKISTFGIGALQSLEPALDLLKPTVGLVWQDIGNTRFSGAIPDTQQSLSLGFGFHPTWNKWNFHLDNDFRELNQKVAFIKKWNIGIEAQAPKLWGFFQAAARVGADQGYLAAGTTLDLRFFKLEFATFAEDAGRFTRQKGIRQIAANISFGF